MSEESLSALVEPEDTETGIEQYELRRTWESRFNIFPAVYHIKPIYSMIYCYKIEIMFEKRLSLD